MASSCGSARPSRSIAAAFFAPVAAPGPGAAAAAGRCAAHGDAAAHGASPPGGSPPSTDATATSFWGVGGIFGGSQPRPKLKIRGKDPHGLCYEVDAEGIPFDDSKDGATVYDNRLVIWEESPSCGKGKARIHYARGKFPVLRIEESEDAEIPRAMNNLPEASRPLEKLHMYHAQANGRLASVYARGDPSIVKGSQCVDTPEGQKGASGDVITWQIANRGRGAHCAEEED